MNSEKPPATGIAYEVVGLDCGRDKDGVFRCVCGMCRPLRNQRENRSNSGDDSRNGRNDTYNRADNKTVPVCPLP